MATQKKKTGKPSDFQGKRLEFLLEFHPIYADASQRGKTRGIWTDFFVRYWAQFPWRLPLNKDPDPADPTDYALAPQNTAEEEEKKATIPATEQKIKLWLGRQSKASGLKDNPWREWLTRFRTPATSAPKKLADYQFYMQQKQYKLLITAEFERRKETVTAREHMKLRTLIAREHLARESQEIQTRMKEGADEEHAALMTKYDDALSGLPGLDEEDFAEARSRFSALVQPLLAGLQAHTGYEISLLAGRVKKEGGSLDIECVGSHAGVFAGSPAELDFSRADPSVYADVKSGVDEFREGRPIVPEKTVPEASTASAQPAPTVPEQPVAIARHPAASNTVGEELLTRSTQTDGNHASNAFDTFSDADIRAHLGLDAQPPPHFNGEFDFPESLLFGPNPMVPSEAIPISRPPTTSNAAEAAPPTAPNADATQFAVPLSKELLMQLEGMSAEARATRVKALSLMDGEALERENNSARNRYMLEGVGLGNAARETLWGGSVAPPAKRKAGNDDGRKESGKRGRKRRDPVLDSEEEGEDSDTDRESAKEIDMEAGTTKDGEDKAAKKKAPPPRKGKEKPVGEWAKTAEKTLAKAEWGTGWAALLAVWWVREARVGFVGTTKGHPAKKRPKEVGDWVGRARNHVPKIVNPDAFGKTWWEWWIDINPEWRGTDRRLKRGGEDEEGRWDCLDLYGQNGFLNVLITLKWWRDALEEISPDWEEAVDDVTWVLSAMESDINMKNTSPVTQPSKSPSPTEPPLRGGGTNQELMPAQIHNNGKRGANDTNGDVPSTELPLGHTPRLMYNGEELSQEEMDIINDDLDADADEE
ncbi:hypothetical protein R3P38DRAFT_3221658 [Favolaschia claudopus]|uniref:Uncharacterized protein n=1 Tax=Favolaschia claudopus TaxID=2862362 RepID=A0AAV9ZZ86_9AGAR